MQKVGVKEIAFVGQSKINDEWNQTAPGQNQNDRGEPDMIYFSSIDQADASLSETQKKDENGIYYETTLECTVRKPDDISLANRYSRRPVVVHAMTVDGGHYVMGTAADPVHMVVVKNVYDGLNSRELTFSLSYMTVDGIL